ncbi:MAG: hypothetical protein OEV49_06440 [candidate division Zixibacteria bacterium]|nr:hypothetical protein [candidate division Zixibacteria bacterium]MDH3935860.1 hypothetical protein [candidate division Zixibacteria bacterium]MDH4034300.1 hypothetical protein [candidate division Zixibacteria bacterium]
MSIETKKLLKNILATLYGIVALLLLIATAWVLFTGGEIKVVPAVPVFFSGLLAYLGLFTASLAYGLWKSKKWGYRLHTNTMIFLIPLLCLSSIKFGLMLWRLKDLLLLSLLLLVTALAIAAQWFLRRNRDGVLFPTGSVSKRAAGAVRGALIVPVVLLLPILTLSLFNTVEILIGRDREMFDSIENDRFLVASYRYSPSSFPEEPHTVVVVDKRTILRAEKPLYRPILVADYRLSWYDSTTFIFGPPGKHRARVINLLNPPAPSSFAYWSSKCKHDHQPDDPTVDTTLAENERYVVTTRSSLPDCAAGCGPKRLLCRDKLGSPAQETVLIEVAALDSISVTFADSAELSVFVRFKDGRRHLTEEIGSIIHHDIDLSSPPAVAVQY